MDDNNVIMGRSISFEKTVQIKQYQPVKFFTSVKDIPFELWKDEEWLSKLWELLVIQVYKMVFIDHKLRTELLGIDSKEEYLLKLEKELLESLDLTNINISYGVDLNDES